jgi:hypothetical protein
MPTTPKPLPDCRPTGVAVVNRKNNDLRSTSVTIIVKYPMREYRDFTARLDKMAAWTEYMPQRPMDKQGKFSVKEDKNLMSFCKKDKKKLRFSERALVSA